MKRNIKIVFISFILLILLGISYFIFFHNVLYIDSSLKNTGRLLPSKNDGTIRFTEEFKLSNYGFVAITQYDNCIMWMYKNSLPQRN